MPLAKDIWNHCQFACLKKGSRNAWIYTLQLKSSVSQSKKAVSKNIKHSRYINLVKLLVNFNFHTKRLYVHMFDIVDILFSHGRGLVVCSSLQEFSKAKESTLHVIWNVYTVFLLVWQNSATPSKWLNNIMTSFENTLLNGNYQPMNICFAFIVGNIIRPLSKTKVHCLCRASQGNTPQGNSLWIQGWSMPCSQLLLLKGIYITFLPCDLWPKMVANCDLG